MNLNQPTAQVERLSGSVPTPMPKDTLSVVLGQSHDAIRDELRYVDSMIQHVGAGVTEEGQNTPACPGALGAAMDLRSQIHRLNGKLEQLAALL